MPTFLDPDTGRRINAKAPAHDSVHTTGRSVIPADGSTQVQGRVLSERMDTAGMYTVLVRVVIRKGRIPNTASEGEV